MKYMKIEHFVERYTFDTRIEIVDESAIDEYENDRYNNYKKEMLSYGEDKYSVKFTAEGRTTLDPNVQAMCGEFEGLEGKLDFIGFYVVYFISLEIKDLRIHDIMLNLNTKFGMIDLKESE